MPRISQLTSLTVPEANDEIAIVDVSSATTKKITRADLLKGADLPNDTVTTDSIADGAVTGAKIDPALLYNYQTDNSNTIQNVLNGRLKVQVGWGQAVGNNTGLFSSDVVFPETFTVVLGAQVGFLGIRNSTPASDITGLSGTLASSSTGYNINVSAVSTTGLTASFNRSAGTFANNIYWGYSWIAWGIVN